MSITTENQTFTASPVISLKGRGKAKRELAYIQIAPLSFVENISRVESIANLRVALGASPTEAETKTAQVEWVIGRVASRLPASEFPKGCTSDDDRLEFARNLVLRYAAPAKRNANGKVPSLRAGKVGWRNESQHRVVRAAEEAWSQVKAELGLGNAQTQSQRNAAKAAKRSTNGNPVRGEGKGKATGNADAPTLSNRKASGKAEAHRVIETAAATLLAFVNKNAGIVGGAYGEAVHTFSSAIMIAKRDTERAEQPATADKPKK